MRLLAEPLPNHHSSGYGMNASEPLAHTHYADICLLYQIQILQSLCMPVGVNGSQPEDGAVLLCAGLQISPAKP